MLGRAPRTNETLLDFKKNMNIDKWDTPVWYRVNRNSQEFRKLTGCQRDPRNWGVTGSMFRINMLEWKIHKSDPIREFTSFQITHSSEI